MNILEWLGVVFLVVIIVNIFIGVWAIITSLNDKEDIEAYSGRQKIKVIRH